MADYRTDILAAETLSWTAPNSGKVIEVTVSLREQMWDVTGLGRYEREPHGLTIHYQTRVAGRDESNLQYIQPLPGRSDGIVAKIGVIGLTQERADALRAMYARMEAHPTYVALVAARAHGERIEREYRAHVAAVDRMMDAEGDRRASEGR